MWKRLRQRRFAVHTVVLLLFVGSSWGLYFAAGNGWTTGILMGVLVLGAVLALFV